MLRFLNALSVFRFFFLTSSGTGAMESCVMNILNQDDEVIVVNGGSFGKSVAELCRLYARDYSDIKLEQAIIRHFEKRGKAS